MQVVFCHNQLQVLQLVRNPTVRPLEGVEVGVDGLSTLLSEQPKVHFPPF